MIHTVTCIYRFNRVKETCHTLIRLYTHMITSYFNSRATTMWIILAFSTTHFYNANILMYVKHLCNSWMVLFRLYKQICVPMEFLSPSFLQHWSLTAPTPPTDGLLPHCNIHLHSAKSYLISCHWCVQPSVGSKQCRACIMPQKQTTQWPMHLFEYLCHPYNNWLWHHFRQCASETVDTEQLGILPANTQHPWMKPLSGMNGPLCHFGPPWNEPENTSELSHDDQTVDTPWRHVDMAKALACATNPLQEDCVGWHHYKDDPKSKKYFAVLGYPDSGSRPFMDRSFTDYLITVLAWTTCFLSPNCTLLSTLLAK